MDFITVFCIAGLVALFPKMAFEIAFWVLMTTVKLTAGALYFVFNGFSFKDKEPAPVAGVAENDLLMNLIRVAPKQMAKTTGAIVKVKEKHLRELQKQGSDDLYRKMGMDFSNPKKTYH